MYNMKCFKELFLEYKNVGKECIVIVMFISLVYFLIFKDKFYFCLVIERKIYFKCIIKFDKWVKGGRWDWKSMV